MNFYDAFEALMAQHFPNASAGEKLAAAPYHSNSRISAIVFGALDDEDDLPPLTYGTFDNCREWGLTVSVGGWTWCAYEHRNSDQIQLQGCPDAEVRPYGPYGNAGHASKWDTLGSLGPHDEWVAADALVHAIRFVVANPQATRDQVKAAIAAAVVA